MQRTDLPEFAPVNHRAGSILDVALLIPLDGSAGIFGPSCELCAKLAMEEVNSEGGVLGRELRPRVVDGGAPPARVAAEIGRLVHRGIVDAVVGWHISAVRVAVAPRIAGRVPYIYTALYEGGERTPGVFLAGETPVRQLLPAMQWLAREQGVRRWYIVGDDYLWPRATAISARSYAALCGGAICGETFVPLGTTYFAPTAEQVWRSGADAVLMLLVGQDAACFNRAFAHADLQDRCLRLSTLVEENTLLASGADCTKGIHATAAYFETLITTESLTFENRYVQRFGVDAPTLNSPGESCYEGVRLLASLARRAGTLDVARLYATANGVTYYGPRGEVWVREDHHLEQRVYLGRAAALDFDVITQL